MQSISAACKPAFSNAICCGMRHAADVSFSVIQRLVTMPVRS
ncbi:MAG: hypothetical protein R3C26_16845 [Calditrichia bacterium]